MPNCLFKRHTLPWSPPYNQPNFPKLIAEMHCARTLEPEHKVTAPRPSEPSSKGPGGLQRTRSSTLCAVRPEKHTEAFFHLTEYPHRHLLANCLGSRISVDRQCRTRTRIEAASFGLGAPRKLFPAPLSLFLSFPLSRSLSLSLSLSLARSLARSLSLSLSLSLCP